VRYASLGIASRKGLSGGLCPDHFFAANLDEVLAWGAAEHAAVLATESAGRCNRCSPHLAGVLGVCVVDCVGGLDTPRKIGPMLKLADIVVLTTGDLVSQAEREVFAFNVRST
jgi:Ni2+-binding GTPase involved in maturation of urease and hydrogenase